MNAEQFDRRIELPAGAEAAFAWHAREGAIDRLLPPWQNVRVVRRGRGIGPGTSVQLRGRAGLLPIRWDAEHGPLIENREFTDRQVSGPFASWEHVHRFEPSTSERSVLEDRIEYRIPGGIVGRLLAGSFIRRELARMFRYRHETTADDLSLQRRTPMPQTTKIAVAGASGLVGSSLVPLLTTAGHEVHQLVRRDADRAAHEISWDPARGRLDPADLDGIDVLIHLGGENIAAGRWTQQKKKRICDSRVHSTRLLAETIARMERPPKSFLCASAIGYYGDRGDEVLGEESEPGQGFLADTCRDWEQAAGPARDAGLRVAHLRFGMILSPRGGALRQMLPLFRLGLGGRVGSGRQYWSWVGIDDAIGAVFHVIGNDSISGPVNVTAPHPLTNREFTSVLAKVMHRPALIPAPALALRTALGQMADELLLASARVIPNRLLESGYAFRHPDLEDALRHLLGSWESDAT